MHKREEKKSEDKMTKRKKRDKTTKLRRRQNNLEGKEIEVQIIWMLDWDNFVQNIEQFSTRVFGLFSPNGGERVLVSLERKLSGPIIFFLIPTFKTHIFSIFSSSFSIIPISLSTKHTLSLHSPFSWIIVALPIQRHKKSNDKILWS